MNDIKSNKEVFKEASSQTGVDPEILAAIASRESRVGKLLDKNNEGDHGKAYGMMQIDYEQNHDSQIEKSTQEHVLQAANIFKGCKEQVKQQHPDWSDDQVQKGAYVAYNSGVKNVQSIENMDLGTTGNDYGSDLVARAQKIKQDKIFE